MPTLRDPAFLRVLEQISVLARRIFAGEDRAERLSRRPGGTVEFRDHRPYVAGDDTRYVDWSVYARRDELVLKEFAAEEDIHLLVLLDSTGSMSYARGDKFRVARELSAALAYVGMAHYDAVTFLSLSGAAPREILRGVRGRGSIHRLLDDLDTLSPGGRLPPDLTANLDLPRPRGRGPAFFLSDFFDLDAARRAALYARERGWQPRWVHFTDPAELEIATSGPVRLVDAESGRTRDLELSEAECRAYQDRFRGHLAEVEEFCRTREFPYIRFSAGTPVEEMVRKMLAGHGFLGRKG